MARQWRAVRVGMCAALAAVPALGQTLRAPGGPPEEIAREVEEQASKEREILREEARSAQMREMVAAERARDETRAAEERARDEVNRAREQSERQRDEAQRQRHEVERQFRLRPPGFLGGEVPAGKSWLGVQLCPVPAALAEHLRLENRGVMVCNVFANSPADAAGIERYDVITHADGKQTIGGHEAVPRFSELIRGKDPDQLLALTVIHRGQEKHMEVKLAAPPRDPGRLRPKYEQDPDVALSREFGLHGRIFRPGPGGGWIMEDLGAFPGFRERLEREFGGGPERPAPERGTGEKRIQDARRVDKDGNTLHVHREGDSITVTRSKAGDDGKRVETKMHYGSMEALRDADREASDLLEQSVGREPRAPAGPRDGAPRPPATPRGPQRPEGQPRDAERDRGDRQSDREQSWREWERRFFQGPLRDPRGPHSDAAPPTRIRFEVAPDGKITVHTRDGDAEMSVTYPSRDEFRQAAPKLFERFEQMQEQLAQ